MTSFASTTVSTLSALSMAISACSATMLNSEALRCYPIVEYVENYKPCTDSSFTFQYEEPSLLGDVFQPIVEVFIGARGFNKDERELYQQSILSMYEKTDESLIL